MAAKANSDKYVLGHSDQELDRLQQQAGFFADFTRDVLARAGLAPGMRVLDVGCGAGDVTREAARLVGRDGCVIGIDSAPAAVEAARARMHSEGFHNTVFELGNALQRAADSPFDAVIGRFILMHVPDPDEAVQSLVRHLRPGGIAAFVEMDLSSADVSPDLPLFRDAVSWIIRAYREDGVEIDMGSRLFGIFQSQGLRPRIEAALRVEGGPDAHAYAYVAETVRSLIPRIEALGIASADEIGIDTLAERLRAQAAGRHVFFYPRLLGVWGARPA